MTPQQFIAKWGPGGPAFDLNERQGGHPHFMDLCELLGVPTPGSEGDYLFEKNTLVLGEVRGYADVFKRNHFAWENKAPGKNLDAALEQLLTYSLALSNPPILVVCDRLTIRIHTQFNGHPSETHTVLLNQLDQPDKLALLRRIWNDPKSFRPKITSRDITNAAANNFATLAEGLRRRNAKPDDSAETQEARANQVAHFLTQCLFCFFAEDVGLLPGRMFERLVNNRRLTSERLQEGVRDLFTIMGSGGMFGVDDIPWFNGGLFKRIDVPALSIMDVTELRNAAALNWSAIDVSIFGTLFERGLDPAKRSQLGAHYTDPATIMRIVEPVLSRPLLQQWELIANDIRGLMAKSTRKKSATIKLPGQKKKDASPGDKSYQQAQALFLCWLDQLRDYRVLDPACGSGNFLFLGLKALKDVEHKSHLDAETLGLDREADLVTGPHNVLGIELNEYAAELARVTVWIGELQWRVAHGYDFKTNPVLEPLNHIECRDALLTWPDPTSLRLAQTAVRPALVEGAGATSGSRAGQRPGAQHPADALIVRQTSTPPPPRSGVAALDVAGSRDYARNSAATKMPPASVAATKRHATEATWPKASVVIGNPPFLGDKKMRAELGDEYTEALRKIYEGRVPGGADLVCYWFEKARKAIETNGLGAAGLVATNSIRGGKNRVVLDAIAKTTRIYEAWSDEGWVNEGAAVRVSLVAFGHATQEAVLDRMPVTVIHTDLTASGSQGASPDITAATRIAANRNACFVGTSKKASFDVPGKTARTWLGQPNPHGASNAEVVVPWINGSDLVRRPSDTWIVDFGVKRTESDASLFEAPFDYIRRVVKPEKDAVRNQAERRKWWLHARTAPDMRASLTSAHRFMATSIVAKHRLWVWRPQVVLASHAVCVTARADDATFGILHSRFHELWSLRMGTSLEDRPRYTPTTCFETFPFPQGLTPADTAHQQTETLPNGTVIPAGISEEKVAVAIVSIAQAAFKTVADAKSSAGRAQASIRTAAIQIAQAAKRLNDLREAWLNPPEWTRGVKEVTPLGMDHSPYPDRIEPLPDIREEDLKALQKRTLTNLYNQRPALARHGPWAARCRSRRRLRLG